MISASRKDTFYPIAPYSYDRFTRTVHARNGALRVTDKEIFGLTTTSYSDMEPLETAGRFGGAFAHTDYEKHTGSFKTDVRKKASALFNFAFNAGCLYIFYKVVETALRP